MWSADNDLLFFYTPDTAFDMIEKYGPAGRDLYTKILLTVDILYPVIYTLFLGLCISWLFQRASNQALWEGVLALVAAVLVASLIVHMWRHAKKIKHEIEAHLAECHACSSRLQLDHAVRKSLRRQTYAAAVPTESSSTPAAVRTRSTPRSARCGPFRAGSPR